jgi:hypothetical protein
MVLILVQALLLPFTMEGLCDNKTLRVLASEAKPERNLEVARERNRSLFQSVQVDIFPVYLSSC